MMERTLVFAVVFVICVILAYIAGRFDGKTSNYRKVAELRKTLALAEYSRQEMSECLRKVNKKMAGIQKDLANLKREQTEKS